MKVLWKSKTPRIQTVRQSCQHPS